MVHLDDCHVVRVVSVPGELHDRLVVLGLVEHRGVFQVAQVELPRATVCADGSEGVPVRGEADVVDFFVVRDQLGVDDLLFDVPAFD